MFEARTSYSANDPPAPYLHVATEWATNSPKRADAEALVARAALRRRCRRSGSVCRKYYDAKEGHALYQRYMAELVLADKVGFDAVVVNEHHNTAYSMMAAPNLIAAAIIPQIQNAKICVWGTLPNLEYPNRLAEEYAMLDVLSQKRLEIAFPLGTGMEYWAQLAQSVERAPALSRVDRHHPAGLDAGRPDHLLRRLLHLPLPQPLARGPIRSRIRLATSSAPAVRKPSNSPPNSASAIPIDPAELVQKFGVTPSPPDWRRPIAPALKKAAQVFGVDPENQADRDLLVEYFAEAHYSQGRAGAPRKLKENQLFKDIVEFPGGLIRLGDPRRSPWTTAREG
jgi:hypothetical protein